MEEDKNQSLNQPEQPMPLVQPDQSPIVQGQQPDQSPIEQQIPQGQPQESAPSREEILAMSRDENKNGDERERQYFQKGNSAAFATSLLIASAILLAAVIRDDRYPCEIMLLFSAAQAVNSLIISKGAVKTRKLYLVLGILEAVLAVFFLVGWILQMCGVMK